ncbi:MAG: type 1 glutamine amidotransferase [Acholeplasma sp.]|jgi:protease I|nr:MAG: type 1 glutamine amidotransferase [Acholeplasma sp.]
MKKIALLIEDLYDDKELIYPYYRMQEEGYQVDLIGSEKGVNYKSKFGLPMKSDEASRDVKADDYEAIIIPGGFSPDYMRRCPATIEFVKSFDQQKKPIVSICHGPWLMISSCDLKGKHVTGFHSIRVDLENAGAIYLDQEVVIDGHLITSRTPKDLPALTKALIKVLS